VALQKNKIGRVTEEEGRKKREVIQIGGKDEENGESMSSDVPRGGRVKRKIRG